VPFDLGHFAHRFIEPFNSESRFYWPAVIALGIALVANIVWYYLPVRGSRPPSTPHAVGVLDQRDHAHHRDGFLMAKAPFVLIALAFGVDLALPRVHLRRVAPAPRGRVAP